MAAVVGVAAGVVIASVDSRPGWDDTGVTAVALAIAAAVTAAISGRRPWLWALVIAIWVPALEVRSLASGGPLLAVVFAGAGAAVGWLVVRGGRSRSH